MLIFSSQGESAMDKEAFVILQGLAKEKGLDVAGGDVRRTSSRFCFGVEHGDYNGTELFGVGTDRFIWMAYKPNGTDKVRMYSKNFPDDGVLEFKLGEVAI
jgi:galactokinase